MLNDLNNDNVFGVLSYLHNSFISAEIFHKSVEKFHIIFWHQTQIF